MGITINLNFNPIPPVAGVVFQLLRVELTDAGGTKRKVDFTMAQIIAAATVKEDGSYTMPVNFPTVGVGPYTVTAQAVNSAGALYGAVASASGVVSLADGAWIPAPTSFS